jgi:hypothetical protein
MSEDKDEVQEAVAEETTVEATDEGQQDDEQSSDFDPNNWLDSEAPEAEANEESTEESEDSEESDAPDEPEAQTEDDAEDDNIDSGPTWASEEENSEEAEEQADNPEAEAEETTEQDSEETSVTNDLVNIKSKTGLDFESEEELIEQINGLKKEREALTNQSATSEVIQNLEKALKSDDEGIVRQELKGSGFSEEEVNEAIDTYKDNGTLKIEAKKIRVNINKFITSERGRIIQEANEAEAKQLQDAKEDQKALKAYVNGTDQMFGLRMSKDDSKLQGVRDGHIKYITSGKFVAEISADEKSVAEAAWLWRNREVLLNSFKNQGKSQGKREILNELEQPEAPRKNRIHSEEKKGFDPGSFGSMSSMNG